MNIGFIGTGAITSAIVTGLARAGTAHRVIVSERSRDVSHGLERAHDFVAIEADNQRIVDSCELVFLAVLPQQAEAVIRPLAFRHGQKVCSVIATIPAETLGGWIGAEVELNRAIPLPPVADLRGITALFPQTGTTAELFGTLGAVVAADSVEAFDAYATGSALMGTYFGLLDSAADWMQGQGTDAASARTYLGALFHGLGCTARESPASFAALRADHSTPGGLNQQMAEVFADRGGTRALHDALDTVAARVREAGGRKD